MRCKSIWILSLCLLLGCGAPPGSLVKVDLQGERPESPTSQSSSATSAQKISYRAELRMVVADLSVFEKGLDSALHQHQGLVADYREQRMQSQRRRGEWTLRVPSEHFPAFLAEAAHWGAIESRQISAEDVTAAHVDLAARLKNQRQLEARLLEMVSKQPGELKDLLAIETELSRVRQEIERMDAQLRLLEDRVAMSTITLVVREDQDYVTADSPTLSGRASAVFAQSLVAMRWLAEGLLLAAISIAPWAMLLVLFGAPFWLVRRKRKRLAN